MKSIILTALATAAVVGAGVHMLHAQAKGPTYQVALIDIKDEAGYKAAVGEVRKHIEAAGGKLVATGGMGGFSGGEITSPTNSKIPSRIVITQYPNEAKWPEQDADMKVLGAHATLALFNVPSSAAK
jgi:uncharacterized protein (DUF1330 family)